MQTKTKLKAGDFKKLNLPFENKLLAQPKEIRQRMSQGVAQFVYNLLSTVFNAGDTAPLVIDDIMSTSSFNPGPQTQRIEDPAQWTPDKIREKASEFDTDKGPEGDFDD